MKLLIKLGIIFVLGTLLFITIDGLTDNPQKSDVIVVLGNKVEMNGEPSERLQSRLDKGLELYKESYAPKVIVSGGFGKEGYDEALVMKSYLTAQGVPSESIILDSRGIDSFNTAQNTKLYLENNSLNSVIVVTNYYHISRTKLALDKVGVGNTYSAHADYFEIRDVYSIAREVVGYWYYLLRKY